MTVVTSLGWDVNVYSLKGLVVAWPSSTRIGINLKHANNATFQKWQPTKVKGYVWASKGVHILIPWPAGKGTSPTTQPLEGQHRTQRSPKDIHIHLLVTKRPQTKFSSCIETKIMQTLLCMNTKPYSYRSVECNLFVRTQVLQSMWSRSTYEIVGSLRSPKWMSMQNIMNAQGRSDGLKKCQATPMNGLCEKIQFHIIFPWGPSTEWNNWREIIWLRH